MENLARAPLSENKYFQGSYKGKLRDFTWLERFHAWVIYKIIAARGFQANLFFTSRKKIEREKYLRYKAVGRKNWKSIYPISNPFFPHKELSPHKSTIEQTQTK